MAYQGSRVRPIRLKSFTGRSARNVEHTQGFVRYLPSQSRNCLPTYRIARGRQAPHRGVEPTAGVANFRRTLQLDGFGELSNFYSTEFDLRTAFARFLRGTFPNMENK